jgi:predicted SprT family Zn-dependent metalloprotease
MNKIEAIREATEKCLEKADALYGTRLAGNVEIRFDIGGYRTAGQAGFKAGHFYLRFHPTYIEEHFDAMRDEVVPHEVAHVVGYAAPEQRARRHNPNWKRICIELGGTGERCHSMDVSAKPTREERAATYDARRPFAYEDEHGRVHYVTAQRHKAMQEGKVFKRGGIRRYVRGEDLSYIITQDGLKGTINKDGYVGKTFNPKTLKKKAAPKKRKPQARARKGQMTKAQIARNLIKLHFPAGPDQLNQEQIIAKIADVCGLSKGLAKTYFNNNLTKAMTEK